MRRTASTLCLAALLAAAAASLVGCSSDVGDDTSGDAEASGDSSSGGRVEAGIDAGSSAADASSADATLRDAAQSDGGAADSTVGDTSAPDASAADTSAPDTSIADSAIADTSVADTSAPDAHTDTPDAGAKDSGAPDSGPVDAGPPDTGAPDTGAPDTGAPDAGPKDSGAPDTGAPDSGPLNACAGYNNGGACTPTEQRFVNKSLDCYKCMIAGGCLDDAFFGDTGHECGDVAGVAAKGAKAGTSRTNLCLDTLDCILSPTIMCAADDVNICYCGSLGAVNGCATATSGADGKCFHQEVDGLEHLATDAPSAVLPDYTTLSFGAGTANQLFVCGKSNGCDTLCAQ